jgi:Ion transport protein
MILKIIAFGLLFSGENSYLRNPANLLDFFVTSLSVLSLFLDNFDVSIIKVFRLFKILRPLRFITRI